MSVVFREFTSSEDGNLFVSRLEGIPQQILSQLSSEVDVQPSTIDHLIAILHRDRTARVYINECNMIAEARASRPVSKGDELYEDDLVDMGKLSLEGIEFPVDAGIVCLFSSGWRKGFFFDVGPLLKDGSDRRYDIEDALGSYMAYLFNQRILSLEDEDWDFLIERGWFPFASLPKALLRKLVRLAKSREDLDTILPEAVAFVERSSPMLRSRWEGSTLLQPHIELLRHALQEFEERDYLSCTSIIYPRIEGILRSMHESRDSHEGITQKVLTRTSTEAREEDLHSNSWLLPEQFRQFVEKSYFANFTPGKEAKLSRNSVGHGVASSTQFNEKAACLGLLLVDQLFFFISEATDEK